MIKTRAVDVSIQAESPVSTPVFPPLFCAKAGTAASARRAGISPHFANFIQALTGVRWLLSLLGSVLFLKSCIVFPPVMMRYAVSDDIQDPMGRCRPPTS